MTARRLAIASLLLLPALSAAAAGPGEPLPLPAGLSRRLEVQGTRFLLEGRTIVIRSGEMHYPRVPRAYWRDRLKKARAMGLNAVCSYVFWNAHEPRPGAFDFSGSLDLAEFVRQAQAEGLWVILRPGPYVCTEWDLGGLPSFLLAEPDAKVRSADPRFLAAAERYVKRVGAEVAGLQSTRGGPILMVQVENEYGSFGRDEGYLGRVRDMIRAAGFEVPLFTSDGPRDDMLAGGTLPELLSVINFGADADPAEAFSVFDRFRRGVPRMVGEYWVGWFDHWGRPHHEVAPALGARGIDWFLERGVSFNLYMFHGGTSFGFWPGANWDGRYWADTTSYDYDAPLDEAGRPTPKFHAYREAILRHLPKGTSLLPLPDPMPRSALGEIALDEAAPLEQLLGEPVRAEKPRSLEALGQDQGFVLYRTRVEKDVTDVLELEDARDYVVVMAGGRVLGSLDRRLKQCCLDVRLTAGETLDLLVENMGRVNFGPRLLDDRKGLLGRVLIGRREVTGFEMHSLPLRDLSALRFGKAALRGPRFLRGAFTLAEPADTFLDLRGFGKGVVFVNGVNLGRFWRLGPQRSLYCPAPVLRPGRNEVVVFELEDHDRRALRGLPDPVYTVPGVD